jgi:hypothetical protein
MTKLTIGTAWCSVHKIGGKWFAMVPIGNLQDDGKGDILAVDRPYQRDLRSTALAKLISNWDDEMCDPIVVSVREKHGLGYVVEGQHRVYAALDLYGPEREMLAEIRTHELGNAFASFEAEAKYHSDATDGKTRENPLEQFRSALAWGEPETVAINYELNARGLSYGPKAKSSVSAVSALRRGVDRAMDAGLSVSDAAGLAGAALDLAEETYGRQSTTWDAGFLEGAMYFYQRYPHMTSSSKTTSLANRIRKQHPVVAWGSSKATAKPSGSKYSSFKEASEAGRTGSWTRYAAACRVIVDAWNWNRKATAPSFLH